MVLICVTTVLYGEAMVSKNPSSADNQQETEIIGILRDYTPSARTSSDEIVRSLWRHKGQMKLAGR